MCGIRCLLLPFATVHRGDQRCDKTEKESRDYVPRTTIPKWLHRRGPDEQASLAIPILVHPLEEQPGNQTKSHRADETSETLLEKPSCCILQASVLCLRPLHVSQPVPIHLHKSDPNNISLVESDGRWTAHLCWNGEVYQVLDSEATRAATVGRDEPKDPLAQEQDGSELGTEAMPSDTQWMANQMQRILSETQDNQDSNTIDSKSSPQKAATCNNTDGDHPDNTAIQQRLHAMGELLSRINGEFAFCLVVAANANANNPKATKGSGIYFGRDAHGRRSLLMKTRNQTRTQNSPLILTEENDADQTHPASCVSGTNMGWGDAGSLQGGFRSSDSVIWEVASVSSLEKKNDHQDMVVDQDFTWIDVPPRTIGYYDWTTQRTMFYTWCPISPPPLPITCSTDDRCEFRQSLLHLLRQAVQRRLCVTHNTFHSHCAVLFSGGLDSTVLAYLAMQVMGPEAVQLVNVSFVNDQPDDENINNNNKATAAADTKAAFDSLHDLRQVFTNDTIDFVHRTVSWSEIQAIQSHSIPRLLYPKQEESNHDNSIDTSQSTGASAMDVNVATALWFAADTAARSKNRILLTGLGADEYMAGYTRHRRAYQRGGEVSLRQELELDQSRLWYRNCGRDDRVLADTSQEVRYPFLDVHVTHFLAHTCPLPVLCDLNLPPGQGDKRLLRELAEELGLNSASKAVKRAIQFGSRISHVVDKQRFGSRGKATRSKRAN